MSCQLHCSHSMSFLLWLTFVCLLHLQIIIIFYCVFFNFAWLDMQNHSVLYSLFVYRGPWAGKMMLSSLVTLSVFLSVLQLKLLRGESVHVLKTNSTTMTRNHKFLFLPKRLPKRLYMCIMMSCWPHSPYITLWEKILSHRVSNLLVRIPLLKSQWQ